jgi:hypothetical protein
LLTADFEIGHYIRDRIIPRAVLFFTGEALEEDEFDDEDEEEEDEARGGFGGRGRQVRMTICSGRNRRISKARRMTRRNPRTARRV